MDAHLSPSKMGLRVVSVTQAVSAINTQFNRDIPWGDIDMDFMNLNQSAHGDREHATSRENAAAAQGYRRPLA
jgi:L-arabinose isomerase